MQRLETFQGLRRYFKDTAETVALYGRRLDDAPRVRVKRDESLGILEQPVEGTGRRAETLREGQKAARERLKALREEEQRFIDAGQWGGRSMADVLAEGYAGLGTDVRGRTTYLQAKLRDVLIPMVTGRSMAVHEPAMYSALLDGKNAMQSFLDTRVGRSLRDSDSSLVRRMYERLEGLSDYDVPMGAGQTYSRGLAKYLYVTHLGVNFGSVILNAMQPMLLAATWMGPRAVAKGYAEGFKELLSYMSERVGKHGIRTLDDATHRALIEKHFKHHELMHIGRDAFETMDNISFPPSRIGSVGHRESVIFDYPMKVFEKAEWLNRSVTAHAMEELHRRAGRRLTRGTDDFFRMQNDVEEMVQAAQFGSGHLNTPFIFMTGPMANPLMRQFLSFPLRSFTAVAHQAGRLGGRTNRLTGTVEDLVRGMGISAMVYETGKGLFGADLSRGLFLSATTDLIGGERFLEDGNEFIPVPPAIDIPIDLTRGVMKGDADLMRMTLPRVIPGGVGLAKLFNVAPEAPSMVGGLPKVLQRTYVDWSKATPDGRHPVFKGDGTLVDFRSGPALILKGLGADLSAFNAEGEIDGFLVQQRDTIVEARRRVVAAYLSGNQSKGDSIRRAFERKFGFPLTISQEQLKQAVRLRETPRTERILDNMPKGARPLYTDLVARSSPGRLGLTEEEIIEADTSRARNAFRSNAAAVDPEVLKQLKALIQEQQGRQELSRGQPNVFEGFEGF